MAEITFREALRSTLIDQFRKDERYFMMGEDIGAYGGSYAVTRGMLEEFGDRRIMDTPIAESVIMGAGIGAAMAGLRPIVEVMTINFSLLALDQVVNVASCVRYMSGGQVQAPLLIRMATGGGRQLAATHSHSLEGWYAHLPGLKVVTPSNPYDAAGMLRAAMREDDPVLFVEHAALYPGKGEVPEEPYEVPLGKANVVREGKDVTVVCWSRGVGLGQEAATQLERDGISAEIIDVRSMRPFDLDTIVTSVKKTGRAVVVEDDWRFGGFAGEVAALISEHAFDYLDAPVRRVAAEDVPAPYNRLLEQASMPNETKIVNTVKAMI
ncbi:MAG: alpha-ketoacid dehydrogenase subunit beta [Dehalococcoidia bacterium]|nr:alpha-ketoacid dehydrogenase subunit beta [Dehalococcoidia bacterium]